MSPNFDSKCDKSKKSVSFESKNSIVSKRNLIVSRWDKGCKRFARSSFAPPFVLQWFRKWNNDFSRFSSCESINSRCKTVFIFINVLPSGTFHTICIDFSANKPHPSLSIHLNKAPIAAKHKNLSLSIPNACTLSSVPYFLITLTPSSSFHHPRSPSTTATTPDSHNTRTTPLLPSSVPMTFLVDIGQRVRYGASEWITAKSPGKDEESTKDMSTMQGGSRIQRDTVEDWRYWQRERRGYMDRKEYTENQQSE